MIKYRFIASTILLVTTILSALLPLNVVKAAQTQADIAFHIESTLHVDDKSTLDVVPFPYIENVGDQDLNFKTWRETNCEGVTGGTTLDEQSAYSGFLASGSTVSYWLMIDGRANHQVSCWITWYVKNTQELQLWSYTTLVVFDYKHIFMPLITSQ
jgi:hypothetical protein